MYLISTQNQGKKVYFLTKLFSQRLKRKENNLYGKRNLWKWSNFVKHEETAIVFDFWYDIYHSKSKRNKILNSYWIYKMQSLFQYYIIKFFYKIFQIIGVQSFHYCIKIKINSIKTLYNLSFMKFVLKCFQKLFLKY